MSKSLYDLATESNVHQIILSNGQIDRIPNERISKLKTNFSGTHTLWYEDMIIDLIKSNYGSDVLSAFRSIKPLAFKADLARYCIVHTYGGWYFDLFVSLKNLKILSSFDNQIDFIFFREMPVPPFGTIYSAVNTLFWVKNKNNPILQSTIEAVVENINNRKYNSHPFAVTGPMVFGREIAKYQLKNDTSSFLIGDTQMIDSMPSHVFNSVEFNNYEVFSQRRRNEDDISLEVPNGYERHPNNYYQMWFNRDIYN